MGIISFSETHINYKLVPMHLLMPPPPPERGSGIHMGNKTLLKTRFDYLPIIKYLVSKFPLGDIKFVITSHLELPEKSIKYPSPVLKYSI